GLPGHVSRDYGAAPEKSGKSTSTPVVTVSETSRGSRAHSREFLRKLLRRLASVEGCRAPRSRASSGLDFPKGPGVPWFAISRDSDVAVVGDPVRRRGRPGAPPLVRASLATTTGRPP